MAYYEGEISPMCYGNNSNNGFSDWTWIIGLALVGGLFGGWGNGGFGFGGNRGGCGSVCATQADVRDAVDQQTLISKIDQQTYGLADTFNSLNNTINSNFRGVDNAICNLGYNMATQFAGVDKAFCTLGYQTQAGFNSLANQISSCCCDLKQLNLENRYLNEKQTCDIIGAINAGNQRLVDIYTNDKLDALRAENTALKGQISNSRQTADIVSQLRDPGCPVASYVVPNPNCCYNPFGFGFGSGYGFNGYNAGGCCGASVQ